MGMDEVAVYRSNIAKVYIIRLLSNMYFISAVLVPFYMGWGKIKFSQILFLNAWFMFWNFLLEIPTGTVADFLGRKVSMTAGCIVGAVGCITYVCYPHYAVFLLSEVIFAFSYTLLSGADEALMYDTLKMIRQTSMSKKIFSRMESFKLGGIVIGAAAGGFIAKEMGLRMPLFLMALPLSIGAVVAATLKEPVITEEKPPLLFSSYKAILVDGVRFFWRSKILKMLTLDMVVVNAIAWVIIWFYQALLKNAGIDIAYFGFVHAAISLFEILLLNNYIRLESILGSKKRLLYVGAAATGAAFIILGLTRWVPLVIAGILISGGFGLTRGPLFSSYINKYIPSDQRATILSTTSMFRTFSIVIVNSISGVLADKSIPQTLIILGVGVIIFASISRIREEHLLD